MKKYLAIIGAAFIAVTSQAQTNSNVIQKIGQGLAALGSSTNFGYAAYGTLANHADKTGHRAYGGGLLGIYSLNDFMGLGGGVDAITGLAGRGQVTIVSFNVQLQLPVHPLSSFSTNSFAQNFTLTPYIYSGLGTPFGATISSTAVIHEAEGINLDVYNFGNDWNVGLGYAAVQRQNAGPYSGGYGDIVFTLHHSFK